MDGQMEEQIDSYRDIFFFFKGIFKETVCMHMFGVCFLEMKAG